MVTPVTTKIKEYITKQGMRMTASRMQVIEAISTTKTPFTIEELATDLVDVGRATVFRNVKLLLQIGVLCRLTMHAGQVHYRINESWATHHHHMICVDCQAVRDFQMPVLEAEIKRIFEADVEVIDHEVSIFFRCNKCRRLK